MLVRKSHEVLICLCLLALAQPAAASILTNGGLELLAGDTFRTVLPGSSYAGWNSVGNGDVEFDAAFFSPKAEGSGCVDLNGVAYQGAISQVLTTESGVLYRVRFAMSGNPGLPGQSKRGDKTMTVSWGGTNVGSFVFKHLETDTQTSLRWEYHELLVYGSGQDELRFTSTTAAYNDAGPIIDDISLSLIADPLLSIRVSQVEICWNTESNLTYQLEYRSSLTTNLWVSLGDPLLGIGGKICTNDTVLPDEPQRFYRVARSPQIR